MTPPTNDGRFVALLEQHKRLLFKVANAYAREPADRADLVQEITVALWRAFPRYDQSLPFPTWAYRVALNVAISASRRERRRAQTHVTADESILEVAGDDPWAAARDERLDQLHVFIARLDAIDRAVMLLYLDGFDHREIGEALGMNASAVGTRVSRIKDKLRRAFAAVATLTGAPNGTR